MLSTGTILLFAAYPLILLADALTRRLLGEGSEQTGNHSSFSTPRRHFQQRIMIIVLAVALAPIAEEFIFRFFLYGVLKRYFGRGVGLVVNALLFAAVHAHLAFFRRRSLSSEVALRLPTNGAVPFLSP